MRLHIVQPHRNVVVKVLDIIQSAPPFHKKAPKGAFLLAESEAALPRVSFRSRANCLACVFIQMPVVFHVSLISCENDKNLLN